MLNPGKISPETGMKWKERQKHGLGSMLLPLLIILLWY